MKVPEYRDLLTSYESLITGAGNPGLEGAWYARLGFCEFSFGNLDLAIEISNKAAALCEEFGNPEDTALAYLSMLYALCFKGSFERVFALKKEIVSKGVEHFNLPLYVYTYCMASIACQFVGQWNEAVRMGQTAVDAAKEASDNSLISFAAMITSLALTHKNDMTSGMKYGELAIEKAATPGDRAMSQATLAWAWCRSGELEKGINALARLVEAFRLARFVPAEINYANYLAEGYLLVGEYDKARQTADELLEKAEHCGARPRCASAHSVLGEIALRTNPNEAAPHFDKAISIAREIKVENELALAYSGMGRFHKQQGNTDEAREYLTKALEIFERLGTLIEPDRVREELAGL
jgi:tetratricopeptide (TPR) repeat protein